MAKKTVNNELFSFSVRHQIGLTRYSTSTVKKMVGMLNRTQVRILDQIARMDIGDGGSFSQARLDALLEAVQRISDEGNRVLAGSLDEDIRDLGDHEGELNSRALKKTIPVKVVIAEPSADQIYAAVSSRPFQGKLLNEWYSNLAVSSRAPIMEALRQGYVEGRTTDQIIRDLRGTRAAKYTDGLLQQPRRSVERTVRTALNHTANIAREQVYKANDDIVKGVQWVSTLDTRTSDECIALDGKVFPPDSGPRPPAHLNCRSTTTPVVKSWKELGFDIDELSEGTRASMDGEVPASMTYGTWLAGQSKGVQDEVLGPTRAALFRDGGLTVDKFVDEAGRSLTLDQLRAREASAFEEADL